jgi:hypothetical protein
MNDDDHTGADPPDGSRENPFGPPPTGNPFGAPPPDNPFGSPPPTDPFGRPASSDAPTSAPSGGPPPPSPHDAWRAPPTPTDPFAAPPAGAGVQRAGGAIAALVLGIFGIVICPLCAPFAWVLGRQAEQKIDASGGVLSGRGEATAGKILGIVSCVLSMLAILAFVLLVAVGSSVSTSP